MEKQSIELHAFREEVPAGRWQALYEATWPAYRSWYVREGMAARPSVAEAEDALQRYMPELVPTWRRLASLTGHDPISSAMLSHWNMPAFAPACSQAVVSNGVRALIRNYDYHPDLFEQVVMSTRLRRRDVLGTSDCLWGLLDGMNANGLAVSLAFGGGRGSGPGFGIPLVVRYLLEIADTVAAAMSALRTIPVSMSYNLTMTDRLGAAGTAYVAPGRRPEIRRCAVATNHRFDRPDCPGHASRFRSVERRRHLQHLLTRRPHPDQLAQEFLRSPLRNV